MEKQNRTQVHNIEPVYAGDSRVLILGSFPSVRSRADGFFYAHPQNRFWRVLAALFASAVPQSVEEKKAPALCAASGALGRMRPLQCVGLRGCLHPRRSAQ